ncbi:MAG: DUF4065 domain-containing protein [Firmicutes bacterium]|nr:DUF4065 domain-containing protein [Bacillota bacterium]
MIKDNMINAKIIAKYFLTKSELTPKKIQKLVYYSYSWFIALNNENENEINSLLFDETPEAWIHGPVFKTLYNEYRTFNWHEVPKNEEHMIFENDSIIPFLEHIWEEYGKFDADQLEYMTHHELPWQNARKGMSALDYSNKEISKKDIFIYFNNLAHE